MSAQDPFKKMLADQKRLVEMTSGNNVLRIFRNNSNWQKILGGQGLLSGLFQNQPGVTAAMQGKLLTQDYFQKDRRKIIQAMAGQSTALKLMANQNWARELTGGPSLAQKLINQNRILLDTVIDNPSFAGALDVNKKVSELLGTAMFSDLVAGGVVPLAAWSDVLAGLRSHVDAGVVDEVLDELDNAAATAGANRDGTWWLSRLPLVHQLILLLATLEVVDRVTKFAFEVNGDPVPEGLASGTEALLVLALAILGFIESRSSAARGETTSGMNNGSSQESSKND